MTPKPEMPLDDDRKVSAEDVAEEAAFYRRLFESNDPTTAMLRDALSRSIDANHMQHLIRLHSSSSDSQTSMSQTFIHAQADLPSLMQRSVGTERATEANLAALRTNTTEAAKDFAALGTSHQESSTKLATANGSDISKVNESAFLGFMKGARERAAVSGINETRKRGADAQFVRDFMKQAKDSPKLSEKEKDFVANFMRINRKNENKDASTASTFAGDNSTHQPTATGIDTNDKELFRQLMLTSIGMRSMGANSSTDLANLLQESVGGGENEFLKFLKSFDAKYTDEKGESPLLNFMRSMSLIGADQNDPSQSAEIAARNASFAFMGSMLKSTDLSTDIKALESLKSFGGISPQASAFFSSQQFLPQGVSLDIEQRFQPAFLNSQSNPGGSWEFSGGQLSAGSMVPPMLRGHVHPNWQLMDNTMLPPSATGTIRSPFMSEGDHSAAEAAMALASMQPREEEMIRQQIQPKRKRQRKVHEPAQKKFVEVNSNDVLFGR